MHGIKKNAFANKKILLVDKTEKNTNDRTWCFWDKEESIFEEIVFNKWKIIEIKTSFDKQRININPYQYKSIQGIDFYTFCYNEIKKHNNIDIAFGNIEYIKSNELETYIMFEDEKINADYIFNSIPTSTFKIQKNDVHLHQHFKGIVVETEEDFFDDNCPTFADFSISQKNGTCFVYIIPQSKRKALIEYTFFDEQILTDNEYDVLLKNYILEHLKLKNYTIIHSEKGVIPMSSAQCAIGENNIINIGTAGGQTKASTGYTFNNIQKNSKKIVECILQNNNFSALSQKPKKFAWYDHVFLHVLKTNDISGDVIFSNLFKKCTPTEAFQFLDEESSFATDIKIMLSMPKMPFIKAALKTF
jgi:lycopene beta-cyclase